MKHQVNFHAFDNFSGLSSALLNQWVDSIEQTSSAGEASQFALAGGSTPAPLYRSLDQLLSNRKTSPIHFVATDERWVADSDAQSNEGLFKHCMPLTYGKQWDLISIKNNANTPEVAVEAISNGLRQQLPKQFNAVLLGMGTDGHIASLFPNAPLQNEEDDCIAAVHPETRQTRMSLSLPRLLNTEKIWLVITGNAKRQVFDTALDNQLPISALLRQAQCNIDVFWCP